MKYYSGFYKLVVRKIGEIFPQVFAPLKDGLRNRPVSLAIPSVPSLHHASDSL